MTTAAGRATANPDPPDEAQTGRRPRLVAHAGAYGLLLLAITAWLPLASSLGTDDGAYGGQVYALQQGDWVLDRPLPVVAQEHEGWFNSAITPEGPLPYTSNPSYAVLLTTVADVAAALSGDDPTTTSDRSAAANALALQSVPVLGALASACVAWALTVRWRRRAAPLAFWLVALGPIIVNATSLWAHTLSTALAGAAVLAAVELMELRPGARVARRVALVVAFAAALVAAAAVRTESPLWIAALCGALVAIHRSRIAFVAAAVGGSASAVAWTANRAWGLSLRADRLPIVTEVETLRGSPGWAASRLPAAWELLLTTVRPGPGPVLMLLAFVLVTIATVRLRRGEHRVGRSLLVAAAVPYLLVIPVAPGLLLAGTVTAWPAVLVLLAGSPPAGGSEQLHRGLQILVWSSAAFAVSIVLTQYASSGGLQWGGRYLSMSFVPLAVAAAIRGDELFRRHRMPLLALLVAPALVGVMASHRLHENHRAVIAEVTARPAEVVVTDVRPLPRLAWPALPAAFYVAEVETVDALLADLADAGVESVNVFGLTAAEVTAVSGYEVTGETERVRYLELVPVSEP